MKPLLIAVFLGLATISKAAEPLPPLTDGNSLARVLNLEKKVDARTATNAEATEAFHALGYMGGFLAASRNWASLDPNCPFKFPEGGISLGQFEKMVEKYLTDHPEKLHEPAPFLLFMSLVDGFANPDRKVPTEEPDK